MVRVLYPGITVLGSRSRPFRKLQFATAPAQIQNLESGVLFAFAFWQKFSMSMRTRANEGKPKESGVRPMTNEDEQTQSS